MGNVSNKGGQRGNTNRDGGKSRTPTSTPHSGSRVEPSHVTAQVRAAAVKKLGGKKGRGGRGG